MAMILKGHCGANGRAQGEALVSSEPVTFWSVIPQTGVFYQPGHELHGQEVKDKVIVYPCGSGAVGFFLWLMKQAGTAPKALVIMRPYPQELGDSVLAGIPVVHGFDRNLLTAISTGDVLTVDGNEGTVEVG